MANEITPAVAAAALAVPLTKLIESISKGIGAVYKPIGIVREAKAQVEANLILTTGAIEERELLARALQRFAFVESRRQANIENIITEAKRSLPNAVSPEPVSDDWIAKFFENCKDIGEHDLQRLWARLLSGEVAQPRTFSRRTMEILRTFSSEDAKVVAIFNDCVFTEKSSDINFIFVGIGSYGGVPCTAVTDIENHLISLGLLNAGEESLPNIVDDWHIDYCGKEYIIPVNPWANLYAVETHIPKMALRRFTVVGNELLKIVSRSPNESFIGKTLKVQFTNSQNQLLTADEFRELKDQREKNKRSGN